MTDYRIEAATKEEWAARALNAEAKLAMVEALMDAGFAEYERRLATAIKELRNAAGELDDYSPLTGKTYESLSSRRIRATLAELKGQNDE